MQRQPLNGLQPRTARETDHDAFDWADNCVRESLHRVKFHGAMKPKRRPPVVIPLDNSLAARALRWLRWAFRLRGPRL